ncbi:DMT family transporter [Aureimonas phyllosphaerae]|uniref:Drug/metabolite transporter (DMT)-like permease n=1 Tax=Aureimonas phyllosphaerae TaxID=1166078 RepID=A0A7W6BLF3_9HYPH|nr:DMT family transporter [Aureimonas phyllosphaerae]MBB3934163.1 drug/metabolite transporter (DMT)-like permease [Aureimonas phyllosphaerae]MBB3958621.1 drug/metabolite transporter (DMT)-like permease [Aureimonas phyllosphaerae]SFE99763.1 EamA-like transporter family protein [Aureimonas phyllosphaerae]
MARAYAALVTLGFIWGTNFISMKMATGLISPAQTVFLRVLFGFLPLGLMAWRTGAITRAQLRHLPHFAVMSVMATTFYYYGFVAGTALLPTSVAGLLSGSIPIFTFLGAALFLREDRPTGQMAAGVALGFVGIVLSAQPWNASADIPLAGVLWMLAGTSSVGCSFVYARRFLTPLNLKPLTLATWQTGLAVVTIAALTDFHGIGAIVSNPHALLGAVVGLGIVGTGGAFLIYYFIIGTLGPVRAAGATYIAPVVAVAIGALIGERIAGIELLALALILTGVVLIQTGKRTAPADSV